MLDAVLIVDIFFSMKRATVTPTGRIDASLMSTLVTAIPMLSRVDH